VRCEHLGEERGADAKRTREQQQAHDRSASLTLMSRLHSQKKQNKETQANLVVIYGGIV